MRMRQRIALAVALLALLSACGASGGAPTSTPTPTPPPTSATPTCSATHTPTPTHTPETSYQLTSESRITLADGTEEAASGWFAVTACYSPNTFFAYRIGAIEIATDSVSIRSADQPSGAMEALTILPEDSAVTFNASVVVNGEPDLLSGGGPVDPRHSGDMINLNLKFGTADLRLRATRVGDPGTVSPEDWCF
jgi:hypothetical protein